jgi:hypothetical protein
MIYIMDENFLIIKPLKKYTFAQYKEKSRDIGTFSINARLVDENLYLLDRDKIFYVLFDDNVVGKIEKVVKESDSEFEKTIEISGRLSLYVLTKRVFDGTFAFSGKSYEYIKSIIETYISGLQNTDERYIPINITIEDEDKLNATCTSVDTQVTGGTLWSEISEWLETDKLCLKLVPNVSKNVTATDYITNEDFETNIPSWNLIISAGTDRRKESGENAVILSQMLNNISRTSYQRDSESYAEIMYIAGEGESDERKWYKKVRSDITKEKHGWNRSEIFVDARDIQSSSDDEDEDDLTDEEYEKLIDERANKKFEEYALTDTYESTLTESDKRYKYNKDFFLGDWCTVIDSELGKILIDAQITEVTTSLQDSEKIIDIGVTYGTIFRDDIDTIIEQTKNAVVSIEKMQHDITYLERSTKYVSDTVKNLYLLMHPVGSVVLNADEADPGTIYGGKWKLVEIGLSNCYAYQRTS